METGRWQCSKWCSICKVRCSAVLDCLCGQTPVEGMDYVPLQVEYNEKYYELVRSRAVF
jgi:polyribonucleotide nucleotidyltransferase